MASNGEAGSSGAGRRDEFEEEREEEEEERKPTRKRKRDEKDDHEQMVGQMVEQMAEQMGKLVVGLAEVEEKGFREMSPNPEELEFFAGQEEVEIMPRFECTTMWLITGDLGPFKPGIPVKIPLWIALHLRAQNKCKLIPPPWMTKDELEKIKEVEARSPLFSKMPSENYMTISKMIFEICPQDVSEADHVKVLIKDIWDNRMSKLRTAVLTFVDKGASWAKVDNLTQMEMCSIRPFFPHALEQLHRFRKTVQVARLYAAGNSSSEVRSRLRM